MATTVENDREKSGGEYRESPALTLALFLPSGAGIGGTVPRLDDSPACGPAGAPCHALRIRPQFEQRGFQTFGMHDQPHAVFVRVGDDHLAPVAVHVGREAGLPAFGLAITITNSKLTSDAPNRVVY
jgi:hypothetical protein